MLFKCKHYTVSFSINKYSRIIIKAEEFVSSNCQFPNQIKWKRLSKANEGFTKNHTNLNTYHYIAINCFILKPVIYNGCTVSILINFKTIV